MIGDNHSISAQELQTLASIVDHKTELASPYPPADSLEQRLSQSSTETITGTSNWRLAGFESDRAAGTHLSQHLEIDVAQTWLKILQLLGNLPAILFNILPRYMRPGGLKRSKPLHLTSYLDALRGVAALFVMNFHYKGFGCGNPWLLEQPFLAVLRSGKGMVNVFFIISGYVLSYKMLKQIRSRQFIPFLDTLTSVTFRRFLRLYLTSGFATFCSMLLMQTGILVDRVQTRGTIWGALLHWAGDLAHLSDPFAHVKGWSQGTNTSVYLSFLWTIPVEFRGSLIVFGFCAGCCKLSTRNRMVWCSILILASFYWIALYSALFLAGLLMADLSFSRHPSRYQSVPLPAHEINIKKHSPYLSRRARISYSILLIISIFLLGQPLHGNKLANYYWPWPILDRVIPDSYRSSPAGDQFWLSIGAILLVFALESYPALQTPFTWDFMQYLGDLSFGIYVCHGQVLATLYKRVLTPMRVNYFGSSSWGCAIIAIFTYLAVLWAADLFTRVDTQLVNLGRWLEKRLFLV
ncbi:hypothetical protein PVAG01_08985 [Phlyctema vagabunda]|uniref:Acyltransferase 3 domain-containing protein n=1 Tax=Phlyctema vagabunda TaxID=108571 RepID=A0ABR4PBQ6_9HELO